MFVFYFFFLNLSFVLWDIKRLLKCPQIMNFCLNENKEFFCWRWKFHFFNSFMYSKLASSISIWGGGIKCDFHFHFLLSSFILFLFFYCRLYEMRFQVTYIATNSNLQQLSTLHLSFNFWIFNKFIQMFL